VLLGVYGLILLLIVQLTELRGSPSWVGPTLYVGWAGLLVLFFIWAPWLLLHKQVSRRDLLPAAVLTSLGLIVIGIVSSFVMEFWINLYARDYGGLGVVLAIYFWLAFSYAVIIFRGESVASTRRAARVPTRLLLVIRSAPDRSLGSGLDSPIAISENRWARIGVRVKGRAEDLSPAATCPMGPTRRCAPISTRPNLFWSERRQGKLKWALSWLDAPPVIVVEDTSERANSAAA